MQNDSFDIDVHDLAALRAQDTAHTVLDVREPHEVAICALEPSLSIPMQQVPERLAELPEDQSLVVLCHHGGRSAMVTRFLQERGFANARNLAGGIDAWAREIDPDMARY